MQSNRLAIFISLALYFSLYSKLRKTILVVIFNVIVVVGIYGVIDYADWIQ